VDGELLVAGRLSLEGGSLLGSGEVKTSAESNTTWSGGVISGISLTVGGQLVLTSGATKTINGSAITIASGGRADWTGGDIRLIGGATLTVAVGGSFHVAQPVANFYGDGPNSILIVQGSMVLGVPGQFNMYAYLYNQGLFDCSYGTVYLHGGATLSGTIITGPTAGFQFLEGNYFIDPLAVLSGSGSYINQGGNIDFRGDYQGSAGFINNGGSGSLGSIIIAWPCILSSCLSCLTRACILIRRMLKQFRSAMAYRCRFSTSRLASPTLPRAPIRWM
jgi:hypothetical protein